jgi:type I restriction enzyme R subunit
LRDEAKKRAAEEGREDMEELFRSMAKRGRQANLSFFAFTATPKHKTLAVFGRDGQPRTATRCGRRSRKGSSSTC